MVPDSNPSRATGRSTTPSDSQNCPRSPESTATDPIADDLSQRIEPPPDVAVPPLGCHVERLQEAIDETFAGQRRALLECLDDPDQPPTTAPSDQLTLRSSLAEVLFEASVEVIETTAAAEAARLERRLAATFSELDTSVQLEYDLDGSFAPAHLRQETVQTALTVEENLAATVGECIAMDTENDIASSVAELFEGLTGEYTAGLASAQTRSAARFASQALAESVDVIDGKRWVHTDACPCPGHASLDGTEVPIEDHFVVEPTDDGALDQPTSAYVVGEDQPTDCRCFQRAVLPDDLPDEPAELAAFESVSVTIDGEPVEPLTPRKIELKHEHARDSETFLEMFDRVLGTHSISAAARTLGTSKKTIYKWGDQFAADLENYNSR